MKLQRISSTFAFALSFLVAAPATHAENPVIEAKGLIAMYDDNELSADQSIKGKTGPVRGTITDISRDALNIPYVMLDDGVRCAFPKDAEAQLSALHKGQVVIIRGKVLGKTLGLVSMDKCVLLR